MHEQLKQTNKFTYLWRVINSEDGSKADIKSRIDKARVALNRLQNIWKSKELDLKTKIKLYNSNVKSILFIGLNVGELLKLK